MEEYEKKNPPTQAYALKQMHKHLPEITKYSLLQDEPHFIPLVGNFAQGMLTNSFLSVLLLKVPKRFGKRYILVIKTTTKMKPLSQLRR